MYRRGTGRLGGMASPNATVEGVVALRLAQDDALAVALATAIRAGDVAALERLLADQPELATARMVGRGGGVRTPLHVATDWPGFFPNGVAVVRALVAAGAEVSATTEGDQPETPLHWAASSDDAEVAVALIDAGADLEMPGGSIGTPLDNAIGYGCWQVAQLLVARGAKVEKLWHAAALGLTQELETLYAASSPSQEDVNAAFWQACHGGQPRAAAYLLARGAQINYVPPYSKLTALGVATAVHTRWDLLASWLKEHGAS